MGNVRFIGCLHLGHLTVAKYRGFNSSEEHDEYLIDQWNSTVHKKDLVYILGDITMENSIHYKKLDLLKGRKIVVMGNHDISKNSKELLNHVEGLAGMVKYQGFWLTHCPVHPQELVRVRGNIHAHIHSAEVAESTININYCGFLGNLKSSSEQGYYNVDAAIINYKPKTIENLLEFYGSKEIEKHHKL